MVAVADKVENERPVFPFTAIIGQEEMKLALILNVIDPRIGGVMIMGDRGTGKSTTIRAVADLLPAIQVAADDAGSKAFEQGLRTLTVQVKGPGSGRETALRSLQSRGFKILSIKDTTPMPHNGARPPKRRRV